MKATSVFAKAAAMSCVCMAALSPLAHADVGDPDEPLQIRTGSAQQFSRSALFPVVLNPVADASNPLERHVLVPGDSFEGKLTVQNTDHRSGKIKAYLLKPGTVVPTPDRPEGWWNEVFINDTSIAVLLADSKPIDDSLEGVFLDEAPVAAGGTHEFTFEGHISRDAVMGNKAGGNAFNENTGAPNEYAAGDRLLNLDLLIVLEVDEEPAPEPEPTPETPEAPPVTPPAPETPADPPTVTDLPQTGAWVLGGTAVVTGGLVALYVIRKKAKKEEGQDD